MEKLQHLKERICSFDEVPNMPHTRTPRRKSTTARTCWHSPSTLRRTFSICRRHLLDGTYTVGPYREFYVKYPKPRLIMALGFRDRVVQWAIYRQLNPYADKRFIQHSYGCRKNKGTLPAARCPPNRVQLISRKPDARDWVLIKCDVSKYFYRVDHKYRPGCLTGTTTDDEWFLRLMSVILNNPDVPFGLPPGASANDCPKEKRLYDVGMPIGNLTSQETANI